MSELLTRSAVDLAELIRSGELSARELVAESLARIDELEPAVNAFTHVAREAALEEAGAITVGDPRPFAGVPIAIKDNRPVAGMPMTMCSDLFGDFVPAHDAYLVTRLRAAGFVVVGKTALPEMGIVPTTEPRRFGPTRNPWALERTPGGSSGGSAAAVAAGMVPIAHGNDGGGSTRIPAACCGLVGLKPARGRVSLGPDLGQSFLTCDGVLTRTVADTAHALDTLAGYELGDANWAPEPATGFGASVLPEAVERLGALRVALVLEAPLEGVAVDPECERAAREAAALLESLGHAVEEVDGLWPTGDLLNDFTRNFAPHVSMATLAGSRVAGRDVRESDVEPLTWAIWERTRETDALSYVAALARLERVSRELILRTSRYDAILTPALAQRPVMIGEINGLGPDPWEKYQRASQFTPFTAIANISGLPAVSLPLYAGEDGLPSGVQLIGRPADEAELLRVSRQLELALPWHDRVAQVDAASRPGV